LSTTTRSPAIRNCSRESGKYHANSAAGFARICATFSLRRSVTTVTSAVSPGVDRERRDTEEEEEEEDDEVLKERRSPRERGRMGTSHEDQTRRTGRRSDRRPTTGRHPGRTSEAAVDDGPVRGLAVRLHRRELEVLRVRHVLLRRVTTTGGGEGARVGSAKTWTDRRRARVGVVATTRRAVARWRDDDDDDARDDAPCSSRARAGRRRARPGARPRRAT
jgi:hypothetical protein